jgi:hypothetical protein
MKNLGKGWFCRPGGVLLGERGNADLLPRSRPGGAAIEQKFSTRYLTQLQQKLQIIPPAARDDPPRNVRRNM